MGDGLVTIFRCPFCAGGRGFVAVDPAEIRWTVCNDRVRSGAGWTDFVVFDPDLDPVGPCPHLILLEVEAGWLDQDDRCDGREVSYRHPALAASDPSYAMNRFLWWAPRGDPPGAFTPATPFRYVRRGAEGLVLQPDRASCEWSVWLDALYAVDASRFVEECRAQAARPRSR